MSNNREKFKQIDHYSETLLMNKLEINMKSWIEWGLLQIGAWTDVTVPTIGAFGGDFSVLRRVHIDDDDFTVGTVYEAPRKDWVWETSVDYVDVNSATQNPISPAIVYVDAVPTAPSYISYPLGRVVFNSAIASTSTVTATYSYRNVQVYIADDAPWWHALQYRSHRPDDSHFSQEDDGSWSIGVNHRIQMPCIVLEAVPRAISNGWQLGDGAARVEQDILCHVLANNRRDRNKIVDILRGQFDNVIWLFDNDAVTIAGDFPLDMNGDIVDSSKHYLALVDGSTGHRWELCQITRTQISEVEAINSRLHQGVVRFTCEVILND